MGIAGNQMADELTKEGGGTGHPCPTPFPKSELKNRVNELINAKWEKKLDGVQGRKNVKNVLPQT